MAPQKVESLPTHEEIVQETLQKTIQAIEKPVAPQFKERDPTPTSDIGARVDKLKKQLSENTTVKRGGNLRNDVIHKTLVRAIKRHVTSLFN